MLLFFSLFHKMTCFYVAAAGCCIWIFKWTLNKINTVNKQDEYVRWIKWMNCTCSKCWYSQLKKKGKISYWQIYNNIIFRRSVQKKKKHANETLALTQYITEVLLKKLTKEGVKTQTTNCYCWICRLFFPFIWFCFYCHCGWLLIFLFSCSIKFSLRLIIRNTITITTNSVFSNYFKASVKYGDYLNNKKRKNEKKKTENQKQISAYERKSKRLSLCSVIYRYHK